MSWDIHQGFFNQPGYAIIGSNIPENPLVVQIAGEDHKLGMDAEGQDLNPMVADEWHGYAFKNNGGIEAIYVGYLPGRKNPCVYVEKRTEWYDETGIKRLGSSIEPLAYFRSEKSAREMLKWIDRLGQSFVALKFPEGGGE